MENRKLECKRETMTERIMLLKLNESKMSDRKRENTIIMADHLGTEPLCGLLSTLTLDFINAVTSYLKIK